MIQSWASWKFVGPKCKIEHWKSSWTIRTIFGAQENDLPLIPTETEKIQNGTTAQTMSWLPQIIMSLISFIQFENFNTTTYFSDYNIRFKIKFLPRIKSYYSHAHSHAINKRIWHYYLPVASIWKNDILCHIAFIWTVKSHFSELLNWSNHTFLTPFNPLPLNNTKTLHTLTLLGVLLCFVHKNDIPMFLLQLFLTHVFGACISLLLVLLWLIFSHL